MKDHHEYRVQLFAPGTFFGVGGLICEFVNPKNLGYAKYINDVPEAFFTLMQDDPRVNIRAYEGVGHIRYLRDGKVVWRGFLGEHDANAQDVVFYCYGYEAALYWLLTDFGKLDKWRDENIETIVGQVWSEVAGYSDSQLPWVSTGTIESPYTTTAGTTKIKLPTYRPYYKRALFVFQELASLGTSDTAQIVKFEIAYTSDPTDNDATFNFWRNHTTDQPATLQYGTNIEDFDDKFAPILLRNDIFGVGSGAHALNMLLTHEKHTTGGTYGSNAFGLKQEPLYFNWVRNQADLNSVTNHRAGRALVADLDLAITMRPNSINPSGAAVPAYDIGDRVHVSIDRGITQINKQMVVVGEQVLASRGHEVVRPILQDRSGI